jgi:Protein of unknown function
MSAAEDQPESDEPSADEIAQMRAATPDEAKAVDELILRECSLRWRKVAMVVGNLLAEFDGKFGHLPSAYIQTRMQALEEVGGVEIAGDIWAMRHSEIRLVTPRNEA